MKLFMVFHETEDPYNPGETIPQHTREFYKGFWVKPEEKEQLDRVDSIFAMYGSHVKAVNPILEATLPDFMEGLKELFGDGTCIMHGKGPGVMYIADRVAESKGIFRIGVGIQVEKLDQAPNLRPPAHADFEDIARLPRQAIMDDRVTIPIFNIGGAGTLEEFAISLCSQKLSNNIPVPMLFVDPTVSTAGKKHIWSSMKDQIELLASTQNIGPHTFKLIKQPAGNYCHLVNNYQEGLEIIKAFANDPVAYWKKAGLSAAQVKMGYDGARRTNERTNMRIPHWLDPEENENIKAFLDSAQE